VRLTVYVLFDLFHGELRREALTFCACSTEKDIKDAVHLFVVAVIQLRLLPSDAANCGSEFPVSARGMSPHRDSVAHVSVLSSAWILKQFRSCDPYHPSRYQILTSRPTFSPLLLFPVPYLDVLNSSSPFTLIVSFHFPLNPNLFHYPPSPPPPSSSPLALHTFACTISRVVPHQFGFMALLFVPTRGPRYRRPRTGFSDRRRQQSGSLRPTKR